ncbi:MAG: hypothetical protein GC131_02115 [Alphaproteobacteria bacterium]|nr:hypothetical protein [Alphaproteobacteria bacterium]
MRQESIENYKYEKPGEDEILLRMAERITRLALAIDDAAVRIRAMLDEAHMAKRQRRKKE